MVFHDCIFSVGILSSIKHVPLMHQEFNLHFYVHLISYASLRLMEYCLCVCVCVCVCLLFYLCYLLFIFLNKLEVIWYLKTGAFYYTGSHSTKMLHYRCDWFNFWEPCNSLNLLSKKIYISINLNNMSIFSLSIHILGFSQSTNGQLHMLLSPFPKFLANLMTDKQHLKTKKWEKKIIGVIWREVGNNHK